MRPDITIIDQDYHRNGVGGAGVVFTLFDREEIGYGGEPRVRRMLGVSFTGSRQFFVEHTAVLDLQETVDGNIEFARGNSWRGSDEFGPTLADAWERTEGEDAWES